MIFQTFQIQREDKYLNVFFYSPKIYKNIEPEDLTFLYLPSFVQFYTDDISDEANIVSIRTLEKFKGKGLASRLLTKVFEYLTEIGVKYIYLDDDSDRYRQSNNLYLKMGFNYLRQDGPEMVKTLF